jgi:hypothetical protein
MNAKEGISREEVAKKMFCNAIILFPPQVLACSGSKGISQFAIANTPKV